MASKEEFKNFARLHPELVSYIKSGESSWQKFYEIYDIYGDKDEAWLDYFNKSKKINTDYNFKSLTEKIKNIDLSSIQEHIGTAQKALGIVQELTSKGGSSVTDTLEVISPRPINKIFED